MGSSGPQCMAQDKERECDHHPSHHIQITAYIHIQEGAWFPTRLIGHVTRTYVVTDRVQVSVLFFCGAEEVHRPCLIFLR